jgi:hypothetical protein
MIKAKPPDFSSLEVFQPGTLNPEPFNLRYGLIPLPRGKKPKKLVVFFMRCGAAGCAFF